MWRQSFVATSIALGVTVDDALAAMAPRTGASAPLEDLVSRLRAPQRATRAAALAGVVREIVLAIDEATLR